ncbi:hypothetical protein D3OALGB2SA_4945 [Olavius algarvensis associated proteobacterium Delta 3]|nr:hypothetical protein D3OALGB2SA_4945 [Olavius algarvensis associated proteobacterium Delta 3]
MLLGLFPRIRLSGIRGKIQLLCVLCASAVIVSICLQTEHIYDNHYRYLQYSQHNRFRP